VLIEVFSPEAALLVEIIEYANSLRAQYICDRGYVDAILTCEGEGHVVFKNRFSVACDHDTCTIDLPRTLERPLDPLAIPGRMEMLVVTTHWGP
jgi:hypothetical protein